jgi:two-component system, NarL family, sensor kinase
MPNDVSALAVISLLLIIVAGGIINMVLLYRRKQLKYIKDNEELATSFENKLLQTKLEIQEQTFKTIAQELHDNIGQALTLVKINLGFLEPHLSIDVKDKYMDTKEILTKAIEDLRDISRTLNTDSISKVGLVKAIETEVQLVNKVTGLKTSFIHQDLPDIIHPQVELILFRIVQEALHNVMKHAKATNVNLSIRGVNNDLELLIEDDGIGFNTATNTAAGTGLINIESRCKLINGRMELWSKEGAGTGIKVRLPFRESRIDEQMPST